MSTNYNRYLDLHLCTKSNIASLKTKHTQENFFSHKGTEYFYEFSADMERQARYRSVRGKGFTFDPDAWFAKGNSRNYNTVEITNADESMLRLGENGKISDGLKELRYIGCMVAIEQLKTKSIYPNLKGLVHWINDKTTTNKLRINCHGLGTATGGFIMGEELSVKDLVAALERHGLTREGTKWQDGTVVAEKIQQNLSGLAHNARWKLDSEVTNCEKCTSTFQKTMGGFISNKHHCRRCGGIFCDVCTRKRADLRIALTGPSNQTAKNVRAARVCETCYVEVRDHDGIRAAVGTELKYGLQTITLGLCMGARGDENYTQAAGTLAAGSLAYRLRNELTEKRLRGIKITASNQVVQNSNDGLDNKFGVKYPGLNQHNFLAEGVETLSFPGYIWGANSSLRARYDSLQGPKPAPGLMVGEKNCIYFGYGDPLPQPARSPSINLSASGQPALQQPNLRQMKMILWNWFFIQWKFTSWHAKDHYYAASGGGAIDRYCVILTPPPRVTAIESRPDPTRSSQIRIYVTGTGRDFFKETKSYGVS